jgi:hypothetical protein
MNHTNFSYTKAGVYYDYNSVSISIPDWANSLDHVFFSGDQWDNNDYQDFHVGVNPYITTYVTYANSDQNIKQVSVKYCGGNLNPVIIHFGYNYWYTSPDEETIKDQEMDAAMYGGDYFTTIVEVPFDADILDFVFHDGNGNWENNNQNDWHIDISE